MRRTPLRLLVELAVGAAVVGWGVLKLLESRGTYLPDVPWVVDVSLLLLAVAVFWAGWSVRAYQRGRRPDLDGLRAARTYVLAKAAAITGALLVGWYVSQFLVVLGDLDIDARRAHGFDALYAAAAALVLAVVGVIVERFCQLPPSKGEDTEKSPQGRGPEADARP
jgi:hypothetical protein